MLRFQVYIIVKDNFFFNLIWKPLSLKLKVKNPQDFSVFKYNIKTLLITLVYYFLMRRPHCRNVQADHE